MAGIAGFYRRNLPSPATEFSSHEGKQIFAEALSAGSMEGFFKLISYYQTQSEPAYCGLASLSMVLNALAIDPGRKWKGPWRWFDDTMLDCCEPLEKVKISGITFGKVACLAYCNGAAVKAFHTNETTIEEFRSSVISCTSSEDSHLIVSYHRGYLKQTGTGHFSPVGGYHVGKDLVLILDVARFKYPPHWVPLTLLWDAMCTVDEDTRRHRGFMILEKPQIAPSILYTVNCRQISWDSTAKYLTKDLPHILSSAQIKDVQELLATVMVSAPSDLKDFINWVAEIRLQDDPSEVSEEEKERLSLKEEVLNQVYKTELFEHVTKYLLVSKTSKLCCQGTQTFSGMFGSRVLKDDDTDKSTVIVSGERRIDVLIPYCQVNSDGNSCCGSTHVGRMHPSVVDVVTVLLFALPPQTWLGIQNEGLKEEIHRLTFTNDLLPSLQQEVLHLRQQLHFLSTSLCIL
ncbi:hypothetical protein V2J09_002238 [Rumex salicifolius]